MQYKNHCVSNHSVYWYQKECDRFKIALGSGYFLNMGQLIDINGNLEIVVTNSGVDPLLTDALDTTPDVILGGVNSNVVDSIESGDIPVLGVTPQPSPSGSGLTDVGHGLFVNLGPKNLERFHLEQSRDTNFGNVVIDGSIGGNRGSSSDIFLRQPSLNITPPSDGGSPQTPSGIGDLATELSSSIVEEQSVVDIGGGISTTIQNNPELKIDFIRDGSFYFRFNPSFVDEHYALSGHDFKVVLEISPYFIRDFGWSIVRCKLYIPDLSVVLHRSGVKIESVVENPNILALPQDISRYVFYLSKINGYLNEYINSRKKFTYYNFLYDSCLSTTGDRDYSVLELKNEYNFYSKDFEDFARDNQEHNVSSIFDIYSRKTFDSRGNDFSLLQGTNQNVAILVSGDIESSEINRIFSLRGNAPYGASFSLPTYDTPVNSILDNNKLVNLFNLSMFYDFVNRDYKFCYDDVPCVKLKNVEAKFINTRSTYVGSWVHALAFGVLPELDLNSFKTTIYDFGNDGSLDETNILKDLSLFERRVYAASALQEIKQMNTIMPASIFKNTRTGSETISYALEKINERNLVVQRFLFGLSRVANMYLGFYDIQLKFSEKYKFRFSSFNLFEMEKYFYSSNLNQPKYDENLKAINFTIFFMRDFGGMFLPFSEEEVVIRDKPPVHPDVSLFQYRDIPNRALFVLNSGYGEYVDKFYVIDDNDAQYLELLKEIGLSDSEGNVTFRSDDYALGFEVYASYEEHPKSFADFSKIATIDNYIENSGVRHYTSSNSFELDCETGKYVYVFFRQVDVHGNKSNPSCIYRISFSYLGDRSVMQYSVFDHKELFYGKKYLKLFKGFRRSLCVRLNEKKFSGEYISKKYKLVIVSRKTNRKVEIDTKFVFENN